MRPTHRAILFNQAWRWQEAGRAFRAFCQFGRGVVDGQGMGAGGVQFVRAGSVDGGGAGVGGPPGVGSR